MPEYYIIDCVTGEIHPLEHENMADIQCAVREYLRLLHGTPDVPNVECMPETHKKVSKIRVSMTDY